MQGILNLGSVGTACWFFIVPACCVNANLLHIYGSPPKHSGIAEIGEGSVDTVIRRLIPFREPQGSTCIILNICEVLRDFHDSIVSDSLKRRSIW